MLKDVFCFAELQEEAIYGLGYNLTKTRNVDNSVLNKANATIFGKTKIISIELFVPHYTPSIPQQARLSKQILSRTPTELQYVERSVFMKGVNTQNFWIFELGTKAGLNFPIWIIVGPQQRDRQHSKILTMKTFVDLQ